MARSCAAQDANNKYNMCKPNIPVGIKCPPPSNAISPITWFGAISTLRPPSVTVSILTSACNAVAFQSPAMPNVRMSLWTQSVHSFSFPHCPLRTTPSRFPKTIRFGSRLPLIRRSVPAHKSLLVHNVVSMLSHWVISRARLYQTI